MDRFLLYLENQYIKPLNVQYWNVFNLEDHRTNNDLEGLHNRLNLNLPNNVNAKDVH